MLKSQLQEGILFKNAIISVNLPASGLLLNLTCAVHSSSPIRLHRISLTHIALIVWEMRNNRSKLTRELTAHANAFENRVCLRGQEARSAIELIRHCAVRMNNDRYSASRPSSPRRCVLTNFRQRCTTR